MKNGAEYIIEFLEKKGVKVVFGYPGGQALNFYEYLGRSNLNHVLVRHEQGAAHAACGYARVTGQPGICIATSGPGATNLVTGIADAYLDSIPMIAFTGQVNLRDLGKDSFQEADITGIVTPITKHSYLIQELEQLPAVLDEAWQLATTGRPGPVLIDVPKNLFLEQADLTTSHGQLLTRKVTREDNTSEIMPQIIEKLTQAERPLILVGGGLTTAGAWDALADLVQRTNIPVVSTLMGKGAYPETLPLSLGIVGMHGKAVANLAMSHCDVLLCLGTRLSDRITGNRRKFLENACIIHVDVDAAELQKNVAVDFAVHRDLNAFFECLLKYRELDQSREHSQWLERIEQWRLQYPLPQVFEGEVLKPQAVILEVARQAGPEAVVVTDVGQHQMFVAQNYPINKRRGFLTSGGLGTMGFGLPAAMGAAFGLPGQDIMLFVGDGGFQMTLQELGTIRQNQLPIKIFIINNHNLGMIRQWQGLFFNQHYVASNLPDYPDYLKLADAYGFPAIRIEHPEELAAKIKEALETPGTVLVDCQVDPNEYVFPMVPPGGKPQEMLGRWQGETHIRRIGGK
jgi:acetolactate synthase-1/2/3 large subunit